MQKEHEDLRSLIDHKMLESDRGYGPFQKEVVEEFMHLVALGMNWLQKRNIVHRDPKASNLLVRTSPHGQYVHCYVTNFDCSIGMIGTGFWRAPEMLQACKEKNVKERLELFSRAADAYGYGMTCYEILTGRLPFEGDFVTMDLLIQGHRPEGPEFVADWARELLCRCWQSGPVAKPSFEETLSILEANSNSSVTRGFAAERTKGDGGRWAG